MVVVWYMPDKSYAIHFQWQTDVDCRQAKC